MNARTLPRIATPPVSRRAWARFLRQQGASAAEIARALGIPRQLAARLMERRP